MKKKNDLNHDKWIGVGGKFEDKESPEDCALRETKEETGLTLTDWAKLLVKFGAQDALNLDGGGSSDLVVNGEVQNSPSDGQERLVGDGLVLVKK